MAKNESKGWIDRLWKVIKQERGRKSKLIVDQKRVEKWAKKAAIKPAHLVWAFMGQLAHRGLFRKINFGNEKVELNFTKKRTRPKKKVSALSLVQKPAIQFTEGVISLSEVIKNYEERVARLEEMKAGIDAELTVKKEVLAELQRLPQEE